MIDLTEIAREITIDDCYQQEMIDMREDIFGDKTIPIQVVESLVKVIDYTYHDEEEHYEDCVEERKGNHFPIPILPLVTLNSGSLVVIFLMQILQRQVNLLCNLVVMRLIVK